MQGLKAACLQVCWGCSIYGACARVTHVCAFAYARMPVQACACGHQCWVQACACRCMCARAITCQDGKSVSIHYFESQLLCFLDLVDVPAAFLAKQGHQWAVALLQDLGRRGKGVLGGPWLGGLGSVLGVLWAGSARVMPVCMSMCTYAHAAHMHAPARIDASTHAHTHIHTRTHYARTHISNARF